MATVPSVRGLLECYVLLAIIGVLFLLSIYVCVLVPDHKLKSGTGMASNFRDKSGTGMASITDYEMDTTEVPTDHMSFQVTESASVTSKELLAIHIVVVPFLQYANVSEEKILAREAEIQTRYATKPCPSASRACSRLNYELLGDFGKIQRLVKHDEAIDNKD